MPGALLLNIKGLVRQPNQKEYDSSYK